MVLTWIIFGAIAILAVTSAVAMILVRSAIYAVLALVGNFISVAMLYLLLGAPFISLAQITVYAGAIMILFLFVVMMLGTQKMEFDEPLLGQRIVGGVLIIAFITGFAFFIVTQFGGQPYLPLRSQSLGGPVEVGTVLINQYYLPIFALGFLLLVATIGAVVLTRYKSPKAGLTHGQYDIVTKPMEERHEEE
jgi:NADH-quinone oxidoreductase subunit J